MNDYTLIVNRLERDRIGVKTFMKLNLNLNIYKKVVTKVAIVN